jgi:hypothetical protein
VKTYTLDREQVIPRPRHDVFAFFSATIAREVPPRSQRRSTI